jgi:hypothetical protein
MDEEFTEARQDPHQEIPAEAAPSEPAIAAVEQPAPPAVPPPSLPTLGVRALAGLQVGITGGLVMLFWFGLDSWLHREFIWKVPHLFASLFYEQRIFRAAFGAVTLAGIALVLAQAGAVGILFGSAVLRPPHVLRLAITALVASMSWYWVSQSLLWRHWIPLVPFYTSPYTMVVAHVLYGLCLARYGNTVNLLVRTFQPVAVLE